MLPGAAQGQGNPMNPFPDWRESCNNKTEKWYGRIYLDYISCPALSVYAGQYITSKFAELQINLFSGKLYKIWPIAGILYYVNKVTRWFYDLGVIIPH